MIVKETETENKDGNEKTSSRISVMAAMELTETLKNYQKQISELLIQGAFSISDMLAGAAFDSLISKRDEHLEVSFDHEEYEEIIDALFKLGVIQPRLQVSLCQNCANYQLAISPNPNLQEQCGKCGSEWTSLTLFTFRTPLDKIKAENSDLPLFISAYLRFKTLIASTFGTIEIYPKAELTLEGAAMVEVDVYLPSLKLGIECKSFEDCFAPLTKNRVESVVGRLFEQIRRYSGARIENVAIITNLPHEANEKVRSAVSERLASEKVEVKSVVLIEGSIDSLLTYLNSIGDLMSKQVSDKFEVRLKNSPIDPRPPDIQ